MLIDSNILVYAINADSPKYNLAKKFLLENSRNLHIAHQNVLETYRILTHPKFPNPMNPKNAMSSILAVAGSCKILSPNNKTYYLVLELIRLYKPKVNHVFDVYLVATALSNEISLIATDNVRDFKKFRGVKIINPFV